MSVSKGIGVLHAVQELTNTLSMADRTVFVTHEQRPKIPDLIMKLSDLLVKSLVLCRVHFHFGLEVSQPLLLALSALQSSHTSLC